MFALPAGCGLRYNKRTKKRTKPAAAIVRRAALLARAAPSVWSMERVTIANRI